MPPLHAAACLGGRRKEEDGFGRVGSVRSCRSRLEDEDEEEKRRDGATTYGGLEVRRTTKEETGPLLVAALHFNCRKHTRIDERRMRRDGAAGSGGFEPCVHEWREERQRQRADV
ncbi:hypothetical protein AMTR_s00030p00136630 [Amborella trichopoda]|uniref:Uncharacterized protein n=1 Tax=Amborella trichopoda TaxID=13333 RepID=U5D3U5_AMBTC|nr:hypothetical protein AMTR_s00030p00136630 [Amborella trichopoda]